MEAQAGIARSSITPAHPVELTGWGYYLERFWREVHDPLYATALVIENQETCLAIVSVDLMVISTEFTQAIRNAVSAETSIPAENILVSATHTHSAPASGGLLGVGEVDPQYEQWAIKRAIAATLQAWANREPARFYASTVQESDLTFNRTRSAGPIDPTLTTLQILREDESTLAMVVGFQGHPTVWTNLRPFSISRDVPGEICTHLETIFPGSVVMYLQGACGDVNFHRIHTESAVTAKIPARQLSLKVCQSLTQRELLDSSQLAVASRRVILPTRKWTKEEIDHDRIEAENRLQNEDLAGWKESIGRVMTNRPHEMVARHGGDEWKAVAAMCRFNLEWTERMLEDVETRPETLETEIQAMRLGSLGIVSNSSEFFSSLALRVREQVPLPHLMLACYTNGRIGYLPDAYDVERKTYAAYQSPKYCNQFPFTEKSGDVMVEAMSRLLNEIV